jgi:His-Xaa-Ser system protein HxsD
MMIREVRDIEISSELYSKEAVLNASYKYSDKFYVKFDLISSTRYLITLSSKDGSSISDEIVNQFYNELIDQQIRINVEKEYKPIRQEIIKKAFAPINK